MLSRISGMLRDMVMAFAFGTGASVASFMVAYRLSHTCRRLFGEGAMQSALIPHFECLRQKDPPRAFAFFRDLTASVALFLIALLILASLTLGCLLAMGALSPDYHEIAYLTLLMLPSLFFICLFGLNASLLQCQKSFFTSAAAPIAFNGVWIFVVLATLFAGVRHPLSYLAIGVIGACLIQWLLTLPKTLQALNGGLKGPFWKGVHPFSKDVRSMASPFLLGLTGVGAAQVNAVIDTLFAKFAQPEGPAFLWYAMRLQQLPLALFSTALASALLPPMTRAIHSQDEERYFQFLDEAVKKTLLLMIPITWALFAMGDICVNLLFGYGDFKDQSVWETTRCLWAYGAGLLPTALVSLLAPACYARGHYRLPAMASFCNMALNFFLNIFFIMGLGWGAVSVAAATSVSAWVNFFLLAFFLSRQKALRLSSHVQPLLKFFSASCLAFLGTEQLRQWMGLPVSALMSPFSPSFSHSMIKKIQEFSFETLTFALLFVLFVKFFDFKRDKKNIDIF